MDSRPTCTKSQMPAGAFAVAAAPKAGPKDSKGKKSDPKPASSANEVWVKLESVCGLTYYWNRKTQECTYSLPDGVEPVWAGRKTAEGRTYYWQRAVNGTTVGKPVWVLPPMQLEHGAVELPLQKQQGCPTETSQNPNLAPPQLTAASVGDKLSNQKRQTASVKASPKLSCTPTQLASASGEEQLSNQEQQGAPTKVLPEQSCKPVQLIWATNEEQLPVQEQQAAPTNEVLPDLGGAPQLSPASTEEDLGPFAEILRLYDEAKQKATTNANSKPSITETQQEAPNVSAGEVAQLTAKLDEVTSDSMLLREELASLKKNLAELAAAKRAAAESSSKACSLANSNVMSHTDKSPGKPKEDVTEIAAGNLGAESTAKPKVKNSVQTAGADTGSCPVSLPSRRRSAARSLSPACSDRSISPPTGASVAVLKPRNLGEQILCAQSPGKLSESARPASPSPTRSYSRRRPPSTPGLSGKRSNGAPSKSGCSQQKDDDSKDQKNTMSSPCDKIRSRSPVRRGGHSKRSISKKRVAASSSRSCSHRQHANVIRSHSPRSASVSSECSRPGRTQSPPASAGTKEGGKSNSELSNSRSRARSQKHSCSRRSPSSAKRASMLPLSCRNPGKRSRSSGHLSSGPGTPRAGSRSSSMRSPHASCRSEQRLSQNRSISKRSRSRQRVAASLSRSRSRGKQMKKCHLSRSPSAASADSEGSHLGGPQSPVAGMSADRKMRMTSHSMSRSKSRGHGSDSPPSRWATRDSVTPRREIFASSPRTPGAESKASSQLQSTPRSSLCGSLSPTSPADDFDVEESADNSRDRHGNSCPPVERDEFNFWEPSTKATHVSSLDASPPRKPEVTQDSEKERCSFWCGIMQDPAPECESILSNFMKNVAETPGLGGSSSDKDDDHSPDMPPGVWTECTTTSPDVAAPLETPPGFWGQPDDVVAPRSCSPLQAAPSGCKKQGSALSASKLFAKAVGGLAGQAGSKRVACHAKAVDGLAGQAATKRVGNIRRSSLGGA